MGIIYPSSGATIAGGNNYDPGIVQNNSGIIPQFAGSNSVNDGIDNIKVGPASLSVDKNTPYTATNFLPNGSNSFFIFNNTIKALMEGDGTTASTVVTFDNSFNIVGEIATSTATRPSGVTADLIFSYLYDHINGKMSTLDSNGNIITYNIGAQGAPTVPVLYASNGYCIYNSGDGTTTPIFIFDGKNGSLFNLDIPLMSFNVYGTGFIGLSYDSGGFFVVFIKTSGVYTKKYITGINTSNYSGASTVSNIFSDGSSFYVILYDATNLVSYCHWLSPSLTVITIISVPSVPNVLQMSGRYIFGSYKGGFWFINAGLYPLTLLKNVSDPASSVKNMTLNGYLNWRR